MCDREAGADANVARGARHLLGFGRQIREPLHAGVVHHHHAGAAERAARERHRGGEIGIDRRHQRQIVQPDLQRLAGVAVGAGAHRPRVIVRIGERGQRQHRLRAARRARLDRRDLLAVDPDGTRDRRSVRRGERMRAMQFAGHRASPSLMPAAIELSRAGCGKAGGWPTPILTSRHHNPYVLMHANNTDP